MNAIYHIFPLGLCGAPAQNSGEGNPVPRIKKLLPWIDHARGLALDTLLLGPIWESVSHGYDTTDYTQPDRRLGSKEDFLEVFHHAKTQGFQIVLDGVFNHCGRDFAPFQDVRRRGQSSPYADWFQGLDFGSRSPFGDNFSYQGWNGHFNLVKFNLANPDLRASLFSWVRTWIEVYGIDGLRLDAADVVDKDFLRELATFCKSIKPGFWLMGEVVHGDYRRWAPEAGLDAVTNYEVHKGLWSSFNDANMYELAYSLNRQFADQGIYRGQTYCNFADNHDVNRIASQLTHQVHLYPLHILLFTIPGVPAVYHGSEAGLEGKKTAHSDAPLRPEISLESLARLPGTDLQKTIRNLATIRNQTPGLAHGGYQEAAVAAHQFAFWRTGENPVLVAINAAGQGQTLKIPVLKGEPAGTLWKDLLNPGETFRSYSGALEIPLWPNWGRILVKS